MPRHGTWKETGGGFSLPVGQILIGAAVAGVAVGIFEAVAAISEGVIIAVLVAVAVAFAAVVSGAVWATVYRFRHGELPWAALQRRLLGEPVLHELPGPERPAIGQQGPRALHQHMHLHVGAGADPAAVAEILRRAQRPE